MVRIPPAWSARSSIASNASERLIHAAVASLATTCRWTRRRAYITCRALTFPPTNGRNCRCFRTRKAYRLLRNHGGTAVLGSKIYCVGGYASLTGNTHSKLVDALDASTGKWSAVAPLLPARHALSAAAYNGKVYAFGGYSSGNVQSDSTEVYDPFDDSWNLKAVMLVPWCGTSLAARVTVPFPCSRVAKL